MATQHDLPIRRKGHLRTDVVDFLETTEDIRYITQMKALQNGEIGTGMIYYEMS